MEKSSKRGKIPQHDWPSIIKRYEAGETLASIARTYDCSPPAISYILSRSRTRNLTTENGEEKVIDPPEPGAVKAEATATPGEGAAQASPVRPEAAEPTAAVRGSNSAESPTAQLAVFGPRPASNGAAAPPHESTGIRVTEVPKRPENRDAGMPPHSVAAADKDPREGQQPAEARRTLRLSMSHNSGQDAPRNDGRNAEIAAGPPVRQMNNSESHNPEFARENPPPYPPPNGGFPRPVEPEKSREGASYIDRTLRERVNGDISAFLAAFDAALADDTVENRAGLREATDRLLRAGARTRIELERLEARTPLPPRDASGYLASPAWRQR